MGDILFEEGPAELPEVSEDNPWTIKISEGDRSKRVHLANYLKSVGWEMDADNVLRKTGLTRSIQKYPRVKEAANNPGTYLENRKKKLIALEKTLKNAYRNEFAKFLNLGFSKEEASERAYRYAAIVYDNEMAIIDIDYPLDLASESLGTLINKSAALRGGCLKTIEHAK